MKRVSVLVHIHGGVLESVDVFEVDRQAKQAWSAATGIPWYKHCRSRDPYREKFEGSDDDFILALVPYIEEE